MGFGLWISAHRSVRSALIARWSSVKVRIGYSAPWFNRWCYTHTVDRSFHRLEEVERLLRLGDPLRMDTVITKPRLVLPSSALEHAAAFWRERLADEGRPVLGLHPGSAWPTKRWPADRFRSVVAGAVERGATVLVFGGPDEVELAAEAAAGCERHVHNLAGRLALPELAAYIARVNCYLCNDSGPMHLAWVQGVPVVALFGPTVRRLGFFPRGPRSLVLERDMPCRPCGLHGGKECPAGTHACMLDIEADVVLDAVWKELTDGTRRGS